MPTPRVLLYGFLNQFQSSLEVSSGISYMNASTVGIHHVLSSLPSRTSLALCARYYTIATHPDTNIHIFTSRSRVWYRKLRLASCLRI